MLKLALFSLFVVGALPAFAAKRVSVEQLKIILAAIHGKPDQKIADQIAGLELTERLGAAEIAQIESDLPGTYSKNAITALADVAEFLPPPAILIPKSTIPDAAKRDSLIALAANYVNQTIPKLPDFFASRVTTRFEDRPAEVATLDGPTIPSRAVESRRSIQHRCSESRWAGSRGSWS